MNNENNANTEYRDGARFFATLFGDQDLVDAIDDGRGFQYAPKIGITTEELAICLPLAILTMTERGFKNWAKIYDKMPPNAQRHFNVTSIREQEETD